MPNTILLPFPTTGAKGDAGEPLAFGEADMMLFEPLTNKVYVTDDAYRVAEVSANGTIRVLQINSSCGTPNDGLRLQLEGWPDPVS